MSKLVEEVEAFVTKAHKGQKYGDKPYTYHLWQVRGAACIHFSLDPVLQAVALLHDVIEDTEVTYSQVNARFGKTIAEAVWALTDSDGPNRKMRQLKTYYRIRKNPLALRVKLCDRWVNMRESIGTSKEEMYVKEYERFKFALYEPNFVTDLVWNHMDQIVNAYHKGKKSENKT